MGAGSRRTRSRLGSQRRAEAFSLDDGVRPSGRDDDPLLLGRPRFGVERYRNRRYHAAVDAKKAPMIGDRKKDARTTSRASPCVSAVGAVPMNPRTTRNEEQIAATTPTRTPYSQLALGARNPAMNTPPIAGVTTKY